MSKPLLLFVVTEDWYFYSHRQPMVKAAQEAGFDVAVATKISNFKEKIEALGVSVYDFDFNRRSLNPFNALFSIFKLIKLYKNISPDIIHHIAMKPIVFGSIAASFAGKFKIVNAFAGLGYVFSSKSIKAKLIKALLVLVFKLILKNNDRYLLFQNPDDKAVFDRLGLCVEGRANIIMGSGVDVDKYKYVGSNDNENLIFVFAGRMIAIKGLDTLREAFEVLGDKKVKAELWLCGEPDEHNPDAYSVDEMTKWGGLDNVKWLGRQSDMADIWGKADVGVQISYGGEGVPKSLLEAASCGKAIIASDTAGCKEVVVAGENGFIVKPYDVDAVVSCVEKMVDDRASVIVMGKKSRKLVEDKFSSSYVTEQTKALYQAMNGG